MVKTSYTQGLDFRPQSVHLCSHRPYSVVFQKLSPGLAHWAPLPRPVASPPPTPVWTRLELHHGRGSPLLPRRIAPDRTEPLSDVQAAWGGGRLFRRRRRSRPPSVHPTRHPPSQTRSTASPSSSPLRRTPREACARERSPTALPGSASSAAPRRRDPSSPPSTRIST